MERITASGLLYKELFKERYGSFPEGLNMDLIKLRYFTEVCRFSNMTKAAASLHVSQQNVSKAILSLETELGTALFIRNGNLLQITNDGEYLLQKANWILAECNVVDSHFSEKKQKGPAIRLMCEKAALSKCPPKTQNLIFNPHPAFNVIYLAADAAQIETAILDKKADFGLMSLPFTSQGLEAITLGRLSCSFFVNRRHPLAGHEHVSLFQMAQYPMTAPESSSTVGRSIERLFESRGTKPYLVVPSYDPAEVFSLVRNNNAFIGFALDHDYEMFRTRDFVKLPVQPSLPDLSVGIVRSSQIPMNRYSREFQSALVKSFQ